MDLPMLGTDKQTETSQFQVMLTDKTGKKLDPALHPMEFPKTNRFFDNIQDRNNFVMMFEQSIKKSGGHLLKYSDNHPLFTSFHIISKSGENDYSMTVYH